MAVKITPQESYANGRKAGELARRDSDSFLSQMDRTFAYWRKEFPRSAELDYRTELLKLEKERMSADLDLAKYPECRGLREAVENEHKGFLEGCADPFMAAFHFNSAFFYRVRLTSRYFGWARPAGGCTAVWFEDTADGPINGKNLDQTPADPRRFDHRIPHYRPHGKPIRGVELVGTASASVFLDEEPTDIFPVDVSLIMPDDIRTVRDFVEFWRRYKQFTSCGHTIYVDERGDSVAIENTNCRMGVRYSSGGVSAVTACAYLTPEMNAYWRDRGRASLEARGWTEDCPDWAFWNGCEKRYRRLLKLVEAESRRGPSPVGLARILLDPEAPHPERISVAGEQDHPDQDADCWTVCMWVSVVFGPGRRNYWWRVSDWNRPYRPIFEERPMFRLGEGVQMRPEWKREIAEMAAIGKDVYI